MNSPSKPGSKADRDALRQDMDNAGCSLFAIAIEMRTRFRMRPREAWRHAHGWTLQEAADRITRESARRPGESVAADASLVGKWEKWPGPSSRRPSLSVLFAMAEAFSCRVEDLLDLEDRRALPDAELSLLTRRPSTAEPSYTPAMATSVVAPPEPAGANLVRLAADESATWAQWAEASNVGDIALEQMLAETQSLALDYLTSDPVALFGRTRALRDRVFALLEGHQYPRQSTDLYAVAGYLCGLLAWMSSDLGQLRDADTQGRTAWLCAELARHNNLRAWVLSTRSKVAFWDGRLRDAINFARRGATYRSTGTVAVLLACQEADAWSELGAQEEAMAALAHAEDARAAVSSEDEIGGIFTCQPARQENYAAAVQLRIGRPTAALRSAEDALALLDIQPVRAYGTEAQIHISQAAAHLANGEAEGALEALAPVLALPPDHRLQPVTRRLNELSTSIGRRSASGTAAVGLRQAVEAFCGDSAPRHFALSPGEGSP
ncbi:tetratricopeptide (TPR) repeat protein/transcriptional regulator with XRE-family HTH domain [Streptomyces sp. SAI-208]|uniref:helix-turn-helix transcriptional regulator n=1 Tax=Streptomyces sp. SAI-208 TaxID=2940550 RepID=UPI002476B1BC|nr:helix-turn-helix transcriptional regulator [Streptomyces sp. SAI-208]MDH6612891.1 tetratricopeptide (TPR) repeat protein/transcriptional regulator with XRE-family HTH domain [Streptomyces sp. SAI-208]